jgi:hypothetical protein
MLAFEAFRHFVRDGLREAFLFALPRNGRRVAIALQSPSSSLSNASSRSNLDPAVCFDERDSVTGPQTEAATYMDRDRDLALPGDA